jgi:hypothetical protein
VRTQKGTVIPERQFKDLPTSRKIDEVKASVNEFESEISHRFKEEEDLAYNGAKPNPGDWSEFLEHDPDFQEDFNNIVNDPTVPEAEDSFTPDVFDDKYLNMELYQGTATDLILRE